jgi:hypothetical protein
MIISMDEAEQKFGFNDKSTKGNIDLYDGTEILGINLIGNMHLDNTFIGYFTDEDESVMFLHKDAIKFISYYKDTTYEGETKELQFECQDTINLDMTLSKIISDGIRAFIRDMENSGVQGTPSTLYFNKMGSSWTERSNESEIDMYKHWLDTLNFIASMIGSDEPEIPDDYFVDKDVRKEYDKLNEKYHTNRKIALKLLAEYFDDLWW